MKTSNSNIYRNTVRPLSSDKQLLFEEEQKKRAAKRNAVLGNLQQQSTSAPKQTAASSITKPRGVASFVSFAATVRKLIPPLPIHTAAPPFPHKASLCGAPF